MSTDKNTPGEWRVRVRRSRDGSNEIVDCFVTAPDVHGYAYDAEVLGDDEYREARGLERKLADCKLIAAAPAMREALRDIAAGRFVGSSEAQAIAVHALLELDKATV